MMCMFMAHVVKFFHGCEFWTYRHNFRFHFSHAIMYVVKIFTDLVQMKSLLLLFRETGKVDKKVLKNPSISDWKLKRRIFCLKNKSEFFSTDHLSQRQQYWR
jgi:hypothetical protein